jgi:putative nucleotidyltransferase with HDIG domain
LCTTDDFRRWFNRYVESYLDDGGDRDLLHHLELKRDHTFRVCEIAKQIGGRLGLLPHDLFIVETAALFHDIGRFHQYRRYRTFSDSDSEDHAKLGEEILKTQGVADLLDIEDRSVLLKAVRDHNLPRYPRDTFRNMPTEKEALVTRIVRDADKIDIYEITCNLYDGGLQAITGLAPGNGISERVCQDVLTGKAVRWKTLVTGNDFKIMQLGWTLDINFIPSLEHIQKKGYLRRIKETLPTHRLADDVYDVVTAAVCSRIKGNSSSGPC